MWSNLEPHLTLPSVMYLQFILRNFSVRASSSSEVDDTTLDWRRGGNAGGRTHSGLGGPSESYVGVARVWGGAC